jgi:hypothetical protein
MLFKRALWALGFLAAVFFAAPSLQAQGNYLDVYIAKVKPEKAFEAEALARKIADANRHNNGDRVLAEEAVYGTAFTYIFVTQRNSYSDVEKGNDAFMASLNKAFGKEGAQKMFADWNNCLVSAHSELRLRRPDLSSKMPTDAQSFAKLVGESRVLRSLSIRVRPGHNAEFESLVKDINSKAEKVSDTKPVLVSQVIEGGEGETYYITFLRQSLAGFDKEVMLKDFMGEEGMAKLAKTVADVEASSSSAIYRFRPDMSYPPDQIAEVATDYWNPKPEMAAAPKPATGKPKAKTEPK